MRRSSFFRAANASAAATPPSPLAKFLASHEIGAQLRTGYTHLYDHRTVADETHIPSAAEELRLRCRRGNFAGQTSGLAPGFVQANLVALPKEHAFDFLSFAMRNPKACPLLAVTAPGDPCPGPIAPCADLRTDLPRYRVWEHGKLVDEVDDASDAWGDDFVGFLLGCSFSWEHLLAERGLTPRHVQSSGVEAKTVPMFHTSVPNQRAGPFGGELVVSMRPYAPANLIEVETLTASYPGAHGGPVHWGNPAKLGISDLSSPEWGDSVQLREGELPVFWACGVTPQTAIAEAALPCLVVTHAPGRMFVCDILDQDLQVPAVNN